MRVLGLDPSLTNFGWVVLDSEGNPPNFPRGLFQTSSKTTYVDRYIDLRERLRLLVQEHQPDRVALEFPIFNDLYSEGMYGLFLFVSEALRLERQDVVFFSPPQIKSHAHYFLCRPKGFKMDKQSMIEAAKEDSGIRSRWNHNIADAYWVARTGLRFWMFYEGLIELDDLTPKEKHQFARVHTYQRGKKEGETVRTGILYRENERFFLWSQEDDEDGCEESSKTPKRNEG